MQKKTSKFGNPSCMNKKLSFKYWRENDFTNK